MALLLLLLSIAAIAVCSGRLGDLLGGLTPAERMAAAGTAVVAVMGLGTDLLIGRSER